MLELHASKGARTVLRGGGAGNSTSLPDWLERVRDVYPGWGESGPLSPRQGWPGTGRGSQADRNRLGSDRLPLGRSGGAIGDGRSLRARAARSARPVGHGEVAGEVGEAADGQVGQQGERADQDGRRRAGRGGRPGGQAQVTATRSAAAGQGGGQGPRQVGPPAGSPGRGRRRCRGPAGSRTGSSARSPRSPPRRRAGASGSS